MKIEKMSATFTRWLLMAAIMVSPILVPLSPASFAGLGVYKMLSVDTSIPVWIHVVIAIAGASGLELVGFMATHVTMRLYVLYTDGHGDKTRLSIALAMIAVYALSSAAVISQIHDIGLTGRAVGIGSVVLSVAVYVLTALNVDAQRMQDTVDDRKRRARESRQTKKMSNKKTTPDTSVPAVSGGNGHVQTANGKTDSPWTKADFDAAVLSGKITLRRGIAEDIAPIAGVNARTIRRWINAGKANGNGK